MEESNNFLNKTYSYQNRHKELEFIDETVSKIIHLQDHLLLMVSQQFFFKLRWTQFWHEHSIDLSRSFLIAEKSNLIYCRSLKASTWASDIPAVWDTLIPSAESEDPTKMKASFIDWVLITEFLLLEIFDELQIIKDKNVFDSVNRDFSWFQIIRSHDDFFRWFWCNISVIQNILIIIELNYVLWRRLRRLRRLALLFDGRSRNWTIAKFLI